MSPAECSFGCCSPLGALSPVRTLPSLDEAGEEDGGSGSGSDYDDDTDLFGPAPSISRDS
jgi:hypothetical protein